MRVAILHRRRHPTSRPVYAGTMADDRLRFPTLLPRDAYTAVALALVGLLIASLTASAQAPTLPPQPTISSVSPAVVKPGEKIIIKGTGFIDVRSVTMAGFSLRFQLKSRTRIEARAPQNAARGAITVLTRGGAINTPRLVVVRPTLQLAPRTGVVGSQVKVTGSGFIPAEPVDVFLGRLPQSTALANGKGEISTSFFVPARTVPGDTYVLVQGRFSGVPAERGFSVESSWPQRGLTAGGNRRTPDPYLGASFAPSLVLDWAADTIGPSSSSPAVVGDLVIAGADTGAVLVMSRDCAGGGQSCTPRSIGITRGAVTGGPAVASSTVYAASEDSSLYAFDLDCEPSASPCEPLWSYETGGPITGSPAVDGDVVVVGSSDGLLYAFDLDCDVSPGDDGTCRPRWIGQTGGAIESSAALLDGVAYVGSNDGYLYAFDTDCAEEGAACDPAWRGATDGVVRSSPAVANGVVYVGSEDGRVHGFATGCADEGEVCESIWRGYAGTPIESSPVIADGYVVVGSNDGSVLAFPAACSDRNAGCSPIWAAETGAAVRSSPVVTGATAQGGPMVIVGSDDGFLYGYPLKCRLPTAPGSCSAVWASGTSGSISASPAVVDGAVYVSSEDGTVRRWSLP